MKYILLLVFTFIATVGYCQFQLRGKLVAADTKTPLVAASVFLSNTSVGTVTNSEGEFVLNIPAGKYDLIASFIGYETNARTISTAISEVLVIELQPKAKVLNEVVVGGYEKDGWSKWGDLFLKSFIGTTQWSADCSIINYKEIKFRHNKKDNILTAVAGDQLVIENKALGYTIKYQLENFEYDFKNRFLVVAGFPLFIPMQGSKGKEHRWLNRREEAYYGSMMQFMRALYRNMIAEEGFDVRRLVKTPNHEKDRIRDVYRRSSINKDSSSYYERILSQPDLISTYSKYKIAGDSIGFQVDSITAGLEFDNYLHVIYTKASPPISYRQLSPHNGRMMSELSLVTPEPIQIQSNGAYYSPVNLVSSGYWSWSEKIANMLPFDYKPEVKK